MSATKPAPSQTAKFQFRIQDFFIPMLAHLITYSATRLAFSTEFLAFFIVFAILVTVGWLVSLWYNPAVLKEGLERCAVLILRMIPVMFLTLVGITAAANLLRSRGPCSESAAIGACKTFASAEDTYRRVDYDGDGVLEYATSLQGLYGSGSINLVDRAFANAEAGPNATPKAGYFFKVLTAQGPHAPGGVRSYLDANGDMTVGYALLAFPAAWDQTGRDSYIISGSGTIYQKDLGTDTSKIAGQITAFDPDTTWSATE